MLAAYCLVSVGGIDCKILKTYGRPFSEGLCSEIASVKISITHALIGLWLTGLVIVAYEVYTNPEYLANQKLWFKFFVVVVLTLNGMLIHKLSEVVKPGLVFASVGNKTAFKFNLAGVVSSTSWGWSCFIGTAKEWNGNMSFAMIMGYYLASLATGMTVAVFLRKRWKEKMVQEAGNR